MVKGLIECSKMKLCFFPFFYLDVIVALDKVIVDVALVKKMMIMMDNWVVIFVVVDIVVKMIKTKVKRMMIIILILWKKL